MCLGWLNNYNFSMSRKSDSNIKMYMKIIGAEAKTNKPLSILKLLTKTKEIGITDSINANNNLCAFPGSSFKEISLHEDKAST